MSDFIIGLTGGIASGKSEVSRRFQARSVTVADADTVAREIVSPGMPAFESIVSYFGEGILLTDGTLDRHRLRETIFDNAEARQKLESFTHPAIRQRLREITKSAPGPYAIAAIPLLTEAGGRNAYPWLNRILVVDAPEALQRERLMRRDQSDAKLADRMIAAQATRNARLAIADDVILNSSVPERLDQAVYDLDLRYRQWAQ